MVRYLLGGAAVAADMGLMVAMHPQASPWLAGYALAAAVVVVLRRRSAPAAFVVAMLLSLLAGGTFALLIWAAYQAGGAARLSPVVAGTAAGGLGVQIATSPAVPQSLLSFVAFVVLPLLVARYLAQHTSLVSALRRHNDDLRRAQELTAERERLRERLRIARDVHDSLGHRLSLVSIQAATLEVSDLPPPQQAAVQQLASAARGALDELHQLVGQLRSDEEPAAPGSEALDRLADGFRRSGTAVRLRRDGEPRPLPVPADQAVYRIVEEGLTNAAKHAPGRPVTVSVEWESDTLLVTVTNPVTGEARLGMGYGLAGLRERVRSLGGLLDHRHAGGEFRIFAMLPLVGEHPRTRGSAREVALGVAAATLMLLTLPAGILLGVG